MKSKKQDEAFLQYLNKMGHTNQTIRSYLYGYNNFLISNPQAETYKLKDVIRYLNEKRGNNPLSQIAVNMLPSIKKFYDFLIDAGLRNDHPCRKLILKQNIPNGIIQQDLFTSIELNLMTKRHERYEVLKTKNQLIISFLIYQGLTAGEIESLNVNHIDLDNGTIYINGTRMLSRGHLDIHPRQFNLIINYLNKLRKEVIKVKSDALIIGKLGTPIKVDDINYLVSTFKPLFPERNLNAKTIRQSVIANWLNEKKIPVDIVQLMAGHKYISSTLKYKFNPIEEGRDLINRFHPLK